MISNRNEIITVLNTEKRLLLKRKAIMAMYKKLINSFEGMLTYNAIKKKLI